MKALLGKADDVDNVCYNSKHVHQLAQSREEDPVENNENVITDDFSS